MALRPDKPEFRNGFARALLDARRYEEALPQLEWLVEHVPDRVEYWRALRDLLHVLGRTERLGEVSARLLALYGATLEENPRDVNALVESGKVLRDLGRHDDALAAFQTALAVNPDSQSALFNTGTLLAYLGRLEEAQPLFDRFLSLYPDHPDAEWLRRQLGELDEKPTAEP